jgi:hypothetical protein
MDLKTGSYSVKAGWQMGAYRLAYFECFGEWLPIVGISIHRDPTQKPKSFVYEHFRFCENQFLCSLEVYKGLYFKLLNEMKWPYLTQNSVKIWLDTYCNEKTKENVK